MKVALISFLLLSCLVPAAVSRSPFLINSSLIRQQSIPNAVLDLRGGSSRARKKGKTSTLRSRTATGKKKVQAAKDEEKKASAISGSLAEYKKILPLTRVYITVTLVMTLLGNALGETAQGLLALDPMRVMYGMEFWRPITAATFLGPPSLNWAFNLYYLVQYGSSLERAYGTPQQFIFLVTQLLGLSILSSLFGQPFFAQSYITSMLHVMCRAQPNQKVKWLLLTVPNWLFPLLLMVADMLQAQGNPAAALPHVLGMLSGHFYFFHKFVWPKMGGEDWLVAPDFLVRLMDPQAKKDAAKEAVNQALSKSRKRGKGRKLGGSKKRR